jgi:hypothetical protein
LHVHRRERLHEFFQRGHRLRGQVH